MKSEWKSTTILDCSTILGDGLHGTPQYDNGGEYSFVNGNNLCDGHIVIKADTKKVSKLEYEKYRKDLNDRTVLVSINGTLGNVALYHGEKVVLGKSACYFNVAENCDVQFMRYVVSSPSFKSYLESVATGTTIKNISLKQMREYTFKIPSYNEQKTIASVLKSIDDKIELNNKINDNLQQQAQAVYKKMFLSSPDPTWREGHLSDLVKVKYGKDHKKLSDGIYPVFGSGGIMRYVERPLYDKESVLIPRKGTLNNVIYVNEPFWSVDTMFYTKMLMPNIAKFVYHFIKSKNLVSMNAGSAVPSMTTDILNAMELRIPSPEVLSKFENIVSPMYQAMQANDQQSKRLASIRDALLPKLMSGEIDVEGVEI